jgi:hypothetical protein
MAVDVVEPLILGLDLGLDQARPANPLRHLDAYRALEHDSADVVSNFTQEEVRRIRPGSGKPGFYFVLGVENGVRPRFILRIRLKSRTSKPEEVQSIKTEMVEQLKEAEGLGVEVVRIGQISFGVGKSIYESGVIGDSFGSEAMVKIVEREFPEPDYEFYPQVMLDKPSS